MRTRQMKISLIVILILAAILTPIWFVNAADSEKPASKVEVNPATDDLRAGKNFIITKVYSQKEDQEILKLFEGLRVADVSDGMDKAGLPDVGLMSPEIHTLWRDTEHYTHRFIGIAVTARYVPTNKPAAVAMGTEAFNQWMSDWYNNISSEPFMQLIRPGTAVVLDDAPDSDVGMETGRMCGCSDQCDGSGYR